MAKFAIPVVITHTIFQMTYKGLPTAETDMIKKINFDAMGRISAPQKRIIGDLAESLRRFSDVLAVSALVIPILIKTLPIYSAITV